MDDEAMEQITKIFTLTDLSLITLSITDAHIALLSRGEVLPNLKRLTVDYDILRPRVMQPILDNRAGLQALQVLQAAKPELEIKLH